MGVIATTIGAGTDPVITAVDIVMGTINQCVNR
jgi:hypothetical protein